MDLDIENEIVREHRIYSLVNVKTGSFKFPGDVEAGILFSVVHLSEVKIFLKIAKSSINFASTRYQNTLIRLVQV